MSSRSEEIQKIEEALKLGRVTRLEPGVNKKFRQYLRSSQKASSLAREAGRRKTGKMERARFDLILAKLGE